MNSTPTVVIRIFQIKFSPQVRADTGNVNLVPVDCGWTEVLGVIKDMIVRYKHIGIRFETVTDSVTLTKLVLPWVQLIECLPKGIPKKMWISPHLKLFKYIKEILPGHLMDDTEVYLAPTKGFKSTEACLERGDILRFQKDRSPYDGCLVPGQSLVPSDIHVSEISLRMLQSRLSWQQFSLPRISLMDQRRWKAKFGKRKSRSSSSGSASEQVRPDLQIKPESRDPKSKEHLSPVFADISRASDWHGSYEFDAIQLPAFFKIGEDADMVIGVLLHVDCESGNRILYCDNSNLGTFSDRGNRFRGSQMHFFLHVPDRFRIPGIIGNIDESDNLMIPETIPIFLSFSHSMRLFRDAKWYNSSVVNKIRVVLPQESVHMYDDMEDKRVDVRSVYYPYSFLLPTCSSFVDAILSGILDRWRGSPSKAWNPDFRTWWFSLFSSSSRGTVSRPIFCSHLDGAKVSLGGVGFRNDQRIDVNVRNVVLDRGLRFMDYDSRESRKRRNIRFAKNLLELYRLPSSVEELMTKKKTTVGCRVADREELSRSFDNHLRKRLKKHECLESLGIKSSDSRIRNALSYLPLSGWHGDGPGLCRNTICKLLELPKEMIITASSLQKSGHVELLNKSIVVTSVDDKKVRFDMLHREVIADIREDSIQWKKFLSPLDTGEDWDEIKNLRLKRYMPRDGLVENRKDCSSRGRSVVVTSISRDKNSRGVNMEVEYWKRGWICPSDLSPSFFQNLSNS